MKRHIASVSWGKDSLCMLLMLIDKIYPLDEVVFYDTGMEFQAIYDTRDSVLPLLRQLGIKYTELQPENPFLYDMFDRPVNGKNGPHLGYSWCGGRCRWGTTAKNAALDAYCGDNIVYVGIAHDEIDRIAKKRPANKLLPLVDWEVPEGEALIYCYQHGYWWKEGDKHLYALLDRVSCWCCANKNLKELRNYYRYLLDYWDKLKQLQARTDRPMKGNGQSVFELEERFKQEVEVT